MQEKFVMSSARLDKAELSALRRLAFEGETNRSEIVRRLIRLAEQSEEVRRAILEGDNIQPREVIKS